ncbi:MAG TPA: cytochrome C oxidase subunit IV family protein [Pyrinomonadaceae bacterium]|jgi:cytochrome c oxidase subunit 4|nr:cytochrome C oxidase subunit IV family protein [Pyrinomonadaceae bacterium]
MAIGSIRDVFKKSDAFLLGLCVLLAAGFLVLAGKSAAEAGNFFTIDNLFFITICLLLALTFIAVPALTMRERGINPFAVPDGVTPARAAEHVHFEGGVKLFINVLGGLLVLTVIEVVLAYVHVPLTLMLTILIGLSLVKAALIMAYFMHLRFERMSLVLTLVPALVICICLLFIVFPDSFRTRDQRAAPTKAAQGQHSAETTTAH